MRTVIIIATYAFAMLFVWIGTNMAPATGWPRTDVELTGCFAITLGMIIKVAGHWQLLGLGSR